MSSTRLELGMLFFFLVVQDFFPLPDFLTPYSILLVKMGIFSSLKLNFKSEETSFFSIFSSRTGAFFFEDLFVFLILCMHASVCRPERMSTAACRDIGAGATQYERALAGLDNERALPGRECGSLKTVVLNLWVTIPLGVEPQGSPKAMGKHRYFHYDS